MRGTILGLALVLGATGVGAQERAPDFEAALGWLVRHQHEDGGWRAAAWEERCEEAGCKGPGAAAGEARYDVGVSALALLALVEGGHTRSEGAHSASVAKGVEFLRAQQREQDGAIGFRYDYLGEQIYNHAVATQALCALLERGDEALRGPCERAVAFCLEAQNPGLGWKYGVRSGRNDTSVTTWMIQALSRAWRAGVEVPPTAFEHAHTWLERATARDGVAGYETPGGGSSTYAANDGKFDPLPTMTAAALLGRRLCEQVRARREVVDRRDAQQALVLAAPPSWPADSTRTCNFYYWYMGARGLAAASTAASAEGWTPWRARLSAALGVHQRVGGCADGSWDPVGEWCLVGGRVLATALNALSVAQLSGRSAEPVASRVLARSEFATAGDYGFEVGYASAEHEVLRVYVNSPAGFPRQPPPEAKGEVLASVQVKGWKTPREYSAKLVALEPAEVDGHVRYGFEATLKARSGWEEGTVQVSLEGLGPTPLVFRVPFLP
ncbi:MAG: prenyltransferase/squalene oxidase repeat-containing protein [Planctomycetota bacterium]